MSAGGGADGPPPTPRGDQALATPALATPAPGAACSVEEHLARVLSGVAPLDPLELGLLDAHGCTVAGDVVAVRPSPGFDGSAMDGYAVRSSDVALAAPGAPVRLPVVAEVTAAPGEPAPLPEGCAVRIMTGAPLPAGADAVVRVEDTDGGTTQVAVHVAPAVGAHVRRAGEDLRPGDVVLEAGTALQAAALGVLAAAGHGRVPVRPRPRVVVVSTGAELVEPGAPVRPGAVPDANSWALVAAAREAGALATRVTPVGDEPYALRGTLEDQLVRADVLITSGGVSMGAHDVVKRAFASSSEVGFWSVDMQPGRPQAYGRLGPDAVPYLGLPGNPVSAMVSFEVFVRPLLRALLGAEPRYRPVVNARVLAPVSSPPGRRSFVRARLEVVDGEYAVAPLEAQGSHQLAAYARATALAVVPEDVTSLAVGDVVPALLLERRGP